VRRFIEQIDAISRHFVDTCVTPAPAPAVDFLGPLAKVFLECETDGKNISKKNLFL